MDNGARLTGELNARTILVQFSHMKQKNTKSTQSEQVGSVKSFMPNKRTQPRSLFRIVDHISRGNTELLFVAETFQQN